MSIGIDDAEIARIDAAIERALATGDTGELRILGYGEVSCVVASETAAGRFAVKRLPPFADEGRLARYEATLKRYIERLEARGIRVARSELRSVPRGRGGIVAYCVQPMVDPGTLGPRHLAAAGPDVAAESFSLLLDHMLCAIDAGTGLDGQISNWALGDGAPVYLDVTTPMLRDAEGREELDVDLFLASLPAPLRPVVKRFMLRSILDKYYERRGVVLDLLGNLIKEKLDHLLPRLLEIANARLEQPITLDQVKAYYADDAGTWALLQRLRAVDRFLQRRVLRRPYPFLLPGKIER